MVNSQGRATLGESCEQAVRVVVARVFMLFAGEVQGHSALDHVRAGPRRAPVDDCADWHVPPPPVE